MNLDHYGSGSDASGASDSEPAPEKPACESAPSVKRKASTLNSPGPVKRAKKPLPSLQDTFEIAPKDDPAQHQGRERARPFVQGEYNTHVYISLRIPASLRRVLNNVLEECHDLLTGSGHSYPLHSLLSKPPLPTTSAPLGPKPRTNPSESALSTLVPQHLHISLTHPLPLRHDQIQPFVQHLRCFLQPGIRTGLDRGQAGMAFRLSLAPRLVAYRNGGVTEPKRTVPSRSAIPSEEDIFGPEANSSMEEADRQGADVGGSLGPIAKTGRAFLALRVAAGHNELLRILQDGIEPYLERNHLPGYHSNPEFHTSCAWTLVADVHQPLTDAILAMVSGTYADRLAEGQPAGGWNVKAIEVKSGKTVETLDLG